MDTSLIKYVTSKIMMVILIGSLKEAKKGGEGKMRQLLNRLLKLHILWKYSIKCTGISEHAV